MKGAIKPDHAPKNNYEVLILGLPPLTTVEVTGLEDEIGGVDLPDRTRASGGNRGPTTFDITVPTHHKVEIAAMDLWFKEAKHPVSPTYKKGGTVVYKTVSDSIAYVVTLIGAWVQKRVLPDGDMSDDGEQQNNVYTISVDDHFPATG